MNAKMLLSPISLTRKANVLKIGGVLGGAAVATVVLELLAQAVTSYSSKAQEVGSDPLPFVQAIPFVGDVTVKDVPSLIPAVAGVLTIIKGRTKAGGLMVLGSIGAKAGLTAVGLNPDELFKKVQAKFTNHIPHDEEDYENDGWIL